MALGSADDRCREIEVQLKLCSGFHPARSLDDSRGGGGGDVDEIQYEVVERIARLRINRPEAKNACTVAMLMHIRERIYEAETDPDVHTLLSRATAPI